MISDVQSLIDLEKIHSDSGKSNDEVGHSMDWTSYHPLEEIYGWFDYLETTYEFCESEIIGQSFEGRDMRVMKVIQYKLTLLFDHITFLAEARLPNRLW